MKRVGIYTGKIYSDEDYNSDVIKECAICVDPALPENESIEQTKTRAQLRRVMMACGKDCTDCEESHN